MNNTELKNERVWRNLLRLADHLGNCGATECDLPSRLPLSQLRVVGVIYDRHPEGVMLKDIADELKLTPGAVSQTVDVLVREDIVKRTVHAPRLLRGVSRRSLVVSRWRLAASG